MTPSLVPGARTGATAVLALAVAALAGCAAAPHAAASDTAWAALSAPEAVAVPAEDVPEGYDGTIRLTSPASPQAVPDNTPVYRNSIRPYLWMAAVDGHVTVRNTRASVSESFGDIWDELDFGAMLSYEHLFDDWSLLLDAFYVKLDEDTKVGPLSIDSEIEQSYLEASALVPLVVDRSVEGIVGARGWYVRNELSIPAASVSKTSQWLDPLIGLRWRMDLGLGWLMSLRGDIGGFGIGSASDFTWQGTAVLGYNLSDRLGLGLGYRYLRVDRDDGDAANGADLALSGALVGLEFRF